MKRIVDSKQAQTQKLIKRADVPIALVFFHGLHSRVHMLSRPTLPTQAQDRPHVAESHHEVSPCCSCQGQGLGKISWKWRPAKCQSAQKSTSSNIEEKPWKTYHYSLSHIGITNTKQHEMGLVGVAVSLSRLWALVRSWCCHCYRWIETKHPPGNLRSWSSSQEFSQKTYDISKPYLVSEVSIVPFNGVNLHTPQQYQIKTPTRRANIYKTWTGHLERPVRVAVHQSISKGFWNPNEKNLKEPKKISCIAQRCTDS